MVRDFLKSPPGFGLAPSLATDSTMGPQSLGASVPTQGKLWGHFQVSKFGVDASWMEQGAMMELPQQ